MRKGAKQKDANAPVIQVLYSTLGQMDIHSLRMCRAPLDHRYNGGTYKNMCRTGMWGSGT